MKQYTRSTSEKFRRAIITGIACAVVIGVPILSARQFIHPHVPHSQATVKPTVRVAK